MIEYKQTRILCEDCGRHMANGYRFSISCSKCNTEFATKRSFETHLKLVHAVTKPFSCDLCSFSTANRSTLKNHRKRVHKRLLAQSCPYEGCKASFHDEWNLLRHIDHVHLPDANTTITVSQTRSVKLTTKPKLKFTPKKSKQLPLNPPNTTIHIY